MTVSLEEIKKRWKKAYKNGFYVDRKTPSLICQELSYYMDLPGRVLDVGAGTGRNAIFFARMGYEVDAVDVVDAFDEEYRQHGLIDFYNQSAEDFNADGNHYLSIVGTRLLQFISPGKVKKLFTKWHSALIPGGYLCLSFVVNNSSLEGVKDYDVPYYYHNPEKIIKLGESMGMAVLAKKYVNQKPSDVNRVRKRLIDSFEIIFVKK